MNGRARRPSGSADDPRRFGRALFLLILGGCAAYGTYEDRLRAIGGLSIGFREDLTLLLIHDGVNLHAMLTLARGRHAASLLYVDMRDWGASWSVSFGGAGK